MRSNIINIDKFLDYMMNLDRPKHELYGLIIQQICRMCEISQNTFIILGSYPMRKYKNIGDLDVDMYSDSWQKLNQITSKYLILKSHSVSKQKIWELEMSETYSLIKNNTEQFKIEIYECDPSYGYFGQQYSLKHMIQNRDTQLQADEFGNQCYSLQTTLRFKKMNNREKDQNDIKILSEVLSQKKKEVNQQILNV